MSISLDAREVLTHLNALGYRNITAEQLKEFIKDLKKLIKYENRIGALTLHQNNENRNDSDVFSKLHENKTTSIQAKYSKTPKAKTKPAPQQDELKPRKILKDLNTDTKPQTSKQEPTVAPPRRVMIAKRAVDLVATGPPKAPPPSVKTSTTTAATTVPPKASSTAVDSAKTQPKTPRSSRRSKSESEASENKMWIRPRICQPQAPRTKDAVQLYHFYQKEWEKFKQHFPGENDHSELRWRIRHKLMGNCP